MENRIKAEAYIGFAIKAGKCRFGMNTVETLKRANLIISCRSASENSKAQALKAAKKLKCPALITVTQDLAAIAHKENAKVLAITDDNLAKAVLNNLEQDFIITDKESHS